MTTQFTTPPRTGDRIAPGPRGLPLIGNSLALAREMHTYLLRARHHYGDVVRFRLPGSDLILLSHPRHVAHVLQERTRDYPKSFSYELLKPMLGMGLLTNEGDSWLRQRRLLQPAFHRTRLDGFAQTMVGHSEATAQRWEDAAARGLPLDIAAEMMRLTLEITGRTLFSVDLSGAARDIGTALTAALAITNDRMNAIVRLPNWVPTPANRRFVRAVGLLDHVVAGMIAERRAGYEADDLLTMLLEARDADTGETMSDQQLRDEVMTLVLAGHETTANGLAWAWHLLATHPGVARRLAAELAAVLGERSPTLADLPHLPYTAMVVDEVLRLYPPAWLIDRQALRNDTIDGYHIPAGSTVMLSPYVTHRHPELWEQPEGFDPERFTSECAAQRPKLAYFPFGTGQRLCIGNQFALLEMRLIIATLARRYRLELVPGHPVESDPQITLRPRHGLLMRPTLRL